MRVTSYKTPDDLHRRVLAAAASRDESAGEYTRQALYIKLAADAASSPALRRVLRGMDILEIQDEAERLTAEAL